MTFIRILAVVVTSTAIYLGLGFEAVAGGRTLWPHLPAVVLILAAWSLQTAPALWVAASIGLGGDAIGTGPLGPGIIAAVVTACGGSIMRDRWQLESPVAASLFGIAVAAGFLAAPHLLITIAREAPVSQATLHLLLARAISSSLAATAVLIATRCAARTMKGMTRVLLNG